MTVIGLSLILGAFVALDPSLSSFSEFDDLPPSMAWVLGGFIMFGLAVTPLMVATVIAFQSINPFSAETWEKPSHYVNPLNLRNPLYFFHFASFAIMAQGAGCILTSFIGGVPQFLYGLVGLFGGLACLGGVKISMKWCKKKMTESQNQNPIG
jgi:hypothetical protein